MLSPASSGRALARHGALPMDRHSTRVPEVTPTRAEPTPEGIDAAASRSLTDGRAYPGGSERTHDSSKDGEPMPPKDLLSALLDLVRAAARESSTPTLGSRDVPATRSCASRLRKAGARRVQRYRRSDVPPRAHLLRPRRGRPAVQHRDRPLGYSGDRSCSDQRTLRRPTRSRGTGARNSVARSASRGFAASSRLRMVETRVPAALRRPRQLGTAQS
jgi:hypothetical protein